MHFVRDMRIGFVLLAVAALGCDNKSEPKTSSDTGNRTAVAPTAEPLVKKTEVIDWCREHGVPESICTRCNESLIAKYKEKGDWCGGHGLPESQCFICNPEFKAKFAADYKAKYGKEPPATSPSGA